MHLGANLRVSFDSDTCNDADGMTRATRTYRDTCSPGNLVPSFRLVASHAPPPMSMILKQGLLRPVAPRVSLRGLSTIAPRGGHTRVDDATAPQKSRSSSTLAPPEAFQSGESQQEHQLFHELPASAEVHRASQDAQRASAGARAGQDALRRPATTFMSMPRYWDPVDPSIGSVMRLLDYVGTVSFGLSGGAAAAACGMDVIGVAMVGTITAVGGGTVRDALFLGRRPFWTSETEYIAMAAGAAILGFVGFYSKALTIDEVDRSPLVRWTDALGLGAFAVIGANNALALALPTSICVLCGVSTATFGGVIRDVLCDRPPRILYAKREQYAGCAAVGAITYVASVSAALPLHASLALGFSSAVCARWASWTYDFKLPAFDPPSEEGAKSRARSDAIWHSVGMIPVERRQSGSRGQGQISTTTTQAASKEHESRVPSAASVAEEWPVPAPLPPVAPPPPSALRQQQQVEPELREWSGTVVPTEAELAKARREEATWRALGMAMPPRIRDGRLEGRS